MGTSYVIRLRCTRALDNLRPASYDGGNAEEGFLGGRVVTPVDGAKQSYTLPELPEPYESLADG